MPYDELAVSEEQVIQNLISLYSALGGGWEAAVLTGRTDTIDSIPCEELS